jgi:hypothetical protein
LRNNANLLLIGCKWCIGIIEELYRIYFADGKYNEPVVVGKITIAK